MSSRLSGLGAWLIQRVSAVYMALYLPLYTALAWIFVDGYEEWFSFNAHPAVAIGNVLVVTSILLHSWVGIRDVIVDYIKPTGLRIASLVLLGAGIGVMGLWTIRIYMVLTL